MADVTNAVPGLCGDPRYLTWLLLTVIGCGRGSDPAADGTPPVPVPTAAFAPSELARRVSLVELAAQSGLSFVHQSGSEGSFPMPAVMGAGAAVFDVEGDGDLDIYLVNGGDRLPADRQPTGARNALYLQEADGSFVDATEGSGLEDRRYGMGTAVGDIDNDGDLDLFVSNWGRDSLFLNEGGGTFRDITERAGVGDEAWSASAVFCELDGDDLLDLFVTRYVDYDPPRDCTVSGGRTDYCGPTQFTGLSDRLYRNLGDGRFEDISRSSGIAAFADAGLGVVCLDFNGDGRLDLYVANDADPNHLWINQGNGRLVNDAILVGLAYNRYGVAEGGMGTVAADADGDWDVDVFVSHLIQETNTYYQNRGAAGFNDATAKSGLGLPSISYTGFGVAFVDLDNDSDLDLVVVNGAVKRRPSSLRPADDGFWSFYGEPNLIFDNLGQGRFADLGTALPGWSSVVEVSRGLIAADFDRDGDLDLLVTQMEGPVRLWRNDGGNESAWIEVRLWDPRVSRETPGGQVVAVVGEQRLLGLASSSNGYLTSGPATVWFGLDSSERVDRFDVRWPDGTDESFAGADARQTITLRRGEGM